MKYRNLFCFLLILPVFSAGLFSPETRAASFPPAQLETLALKLEQTLQEDWKPENVNVSVLITLKNEPVFTRSSQDSRAALASLSKPFTAIMILRLVERGELTLEDPVSRHLPGLPAPWLPVTIHQLLSHTSGLPDYLNEPDFEQWTSTDPKDTQEMMIRRFVRIHPEMKFLPGSEFSYSNTNYLVLGMILEKTRKVPLSETLRDEIVLPLGLTQTGTLEGSLAQTGLGENTLLPNDLLGAASITSSIRDLWRLSLALDHNELLGAEMTRRMFTPNFRRYGYGFFLCLWPPDNSLDRRFAIHEGHLRGVSNLFARFPDDEMLILVLSRLTERETYDLAVKFGHLTLDTLKL